MWLKEKTRKYFPSEKSFNVETINFTENKGSRLLSWVPTRGRKTRSSRAGFGAGASALAPEERALGGHEPGQGKAWRPREGASHSPNGRSWPHSWGWFLLVATMSGKALRGGRGGGSRPWRGAVC